MRTTVWTLLLLALAATITALAWFGRPSAPPPAPPPTAAELLAQARQQAADLRVLDAEKSYQAALALEPKNADAWLSLSILYTASRRHDDAVAALQQWQKVAPPVHTWTYSMLHCFFFNTPEGYQRAREAVLESIRREPANAALYTDMASLVLTSLRRATPAQQAACFQETEQWLAKASAAGAHDANYYVVTGELRLLQKRVDEAAKALHEAIRIGNWRESREEIVARMDLGIIDLHQGKLPEGRDMLDGADAAYVDRHEFTLLTSRPVHEAAIMARHVYFGGPVPLDELEQSRARYAALLANDVGGQTVMLTFRKHINDFYKAIAQNDAPHAIDLGTQLIQSLDELNSCSFVTAMRDHFRAMVWVEIGDLLHARHDDAEAANFYREAVAIYPTDPTLTARLAAVKGKHGVELTPPGESH